MGARRWVSHGRPGGRWCPGPGPPAWGAATCCCCWGCLWCCYPGAASGAATLVLLVLLLVPLPRLGLRSRLRRSRWGCAAVAPRGELADPLSGKAPLLPSVSAIARQGHCPRRAAPRAPVLLESPSPALTLPFGRPCAPLSLVLLPPARAWVGRGKREQEL